MKILRATIDSTPSLTGTVLLTADRHGALLQDDIIDTTTTWSSSKIQSMLDDLANCPIEYIESLDTENLVQLRDIETGPKILYGYFSPYPNSDMSMIFDNTIVIVARKDAGSHLMVLTGLNSKINFLEILVDESAPGGHTFSRTDFNMLEIHGLIARVASLEASAVTRVAEVDLLAANWVGDNIPYSQVVAIDGVTALTQVDLTPSVEQLAIFYDKDLTFVTENDAGTVTVYAIGQRPENDYTMQVTLREVST